MNSNFSSSLTVKTKSQQLLYELTNSLNVTNKIRKFIKEVIELIFPKKPVEEDRKIENLNC